MGPEGQAGRRIDQSIGVEGICPKESSKSNGTWDLGAKGHWYRRSFAL
jgi:hypothetical protein